MSRWGGAEGADWARVQPPPGFQVPFAPQHILSLAQKPLKSSTSLRPS